MDIKKARDEYGETKFIIECDVYALIELEYHMECSKEEQDRICERVGVAKDSRMMKSKYEWADAFIELARKGQKMNKED